MPQMHIHLDMSDVPYLIPSATGGHNNSLHVDGALSNTSCSTTSSSGTVAYATHDLTPYSTVSSFNLPAATDSTSLLTPTSSSGSPSARSQLQHQHQQQKKQASLAQNAQIQVQPGKASTSVLSFAASQASHQPMTPPTSSRMLYPYNTTASGQADHSSTASNFEINSYIHTSPVKEEGVSPPNEPFYAPYGVSSAPEDTSNAAMDYQFANNASGGFYPQRPLPLPHQAYAQQPQQQQQQAAPQQHQYAQSQPGSSITPIGPLLQVSQQHGLAPILAQPHPSQYRTVRGGNMSDYRDPRAAMQTAMHHESQQQYSHPPAVAGVKRPLDVDGRGSVPSGASDDQSTPRSQSTVGHDMKMLFQGNGASVYSSPVRGPDSGDNSATVSSSAGPVCAIDATVTTTLPYVVLSEKASEEEQFLFQLHQQFKGTRGKGMWDSISSQFSEKYPGQNGTARLQMKFTRAFRRYALWPTAEKDILLKAYQEDENQRFARLNALIKDKGGGKVWDWKPVDIEMMLVRLGLEEPLADEATRIRRRRRSALRNRPAQNLQHQDSPAMMNGSAWVGGYSPAGMAHHPQYNLPASHPHASQAAAAYDATAEPAYSADQEPDILEQLDSKYGMNDMSPSVSTDREDAHLLDGSSGSNPNGAANSTGSMSHSLPPPASAIGSMNYGGLNGLLSRTDRSGRDTHDQMNSRRLQTDSYR